jgi:hypothetical protein
MRELYSGASDSRCMLREAALVLQSNTPCFLPFRELIRIRTFSGILRIPSKNFTRAIVWEKHFYMIILSNYLVLKSSRILLTFLWIIAIALFLALTKLCLTSNN